MIVSIVVLVSTSLLAYIAFLIVGSITNEADHKQCAWLALIFGLAMTSGVHAIIFYGYESKKEILKEWSGTPGSTIKASEYIITLEWPSAPLQDIRGDNHIIIKRVDLTVPEAATLGVVKTTNTLPAPNTWSWKLYLVAALLLALFPYLKAMLQHIPFGYPIHEATSSNT